jgi:hypothetical protein
MGSFPCEFFLTAFSGFIEGCGPHRKEAGVRFERRSYGPPKPPKAEGFSHMVQLL